MLYLGKEFSLCRALSDTWRLRRTGPNFKALMRRRLSSSCSISAEACTKLSNSTATLTCKKPFIHKRTKTLRGKYKKIAGYLNRISNMMRYTAGTWQLWLYSNELKVAALANSVLLFSLSKCRVLCQEKASSLFLPNYVFERIQTASCLSPCKADTTFENALAWCCSRNAGVYCLADLEQYKFNDYSKAEDVHNIFDNKVPRFINLQKTARNRVRRFK